jgi:murein DD-endopeptidase MepM/ murein hydrolase activator NlpD
MSPAPVPKPPSAGQGKTAIARTRAAYVNIRTGPSTQYSIIGNIRNNTLAVYYPASRTGNGWVWAEQYNSAGWVSTSVVDFDEVAIVPPWNHPPTPYDGQAGMWHWKGQAVAENTIDQLASNLKAFAPNIKHIWVKVGDGSSWQGRFDDSAMAINGPESVDLWVRTLENYGMEFHAWIVLKGRDIDGEAQIITETCQRPGVRSMILDVEPYEHYWRAGREPIRPLMTRVRQAIGGAFHIGMAIDPRPAHFHTIFPDEWFPFINSVHPMCYWKTFRRPVTDVLEEAYQVWGNYGRPIIPILQGDAPVHEQTEAISVATQRFRARAVSWWRYGVISQWTAVNSTIKVDAPPPTDPVEEPPPGTQFGKEVIIFPGKEGYRSGTYTGQEEFKPFQNTFGWDSYYTTTEDRTSKVWAEWRTDLPESGLYQITVFIPARHATTRRARYKIHAVRGTTTEVVVDINQSIHRNEWVPLGVFDLVKGMPNAGKVFLNDVTGEANREIAFDAVRLREIVRLPGQPTVPPDSDDLPEIIDGVYVADGYDSPVGTAEERRGDQVWPSGWRDASPFGQLYFVGTPREAYHTGADLNWGRGGWDDLGLPTYACASGIVTFAAALKTWGNVIIIRHDPLRSPTGQVLYSRYAHVQNMTVRAGQRVRRGDQVAQIGDAFGTLVPHLHFDLSPTTQLEQNPADWPGKSTVRLFRDYIDPLQFIRQHRPRRS